MSNLRVKVFYEGQSFTIVFAIHQGSCPAQAFLDGLALKDRAGISRIIKRLADVGRIANSEQFKKITGEDFWEFKYFQVRMFGFFQPNQKIVITHGYKKKSQKLDPNQIDRLKRIKEEYDQEK